MRTLLPYCDHWFSFYIPIPEVDGYQEFSKAAARAYPYREHMLSMLGWDNALSLGDRHEDIETAMPIVIANLKSRGGLDVEGHPEMVMLSEMVVASLRSIGWEFDFGSRRFHRGETP